MYFVRIIIPALIVADILHVAPVCAFIAVIALAILPSEHDCNIQVMIISLNSFVSLVTQQMDDGLAMRIIREIHCLSLFSAYRCVWEDSLYLMAFLMVAHKLKNDDGFGLIVTCIMAGLIWYYGVQALYIHASRAIPKFTKSLNHTLSTSIDYLRHALHRIGCVLSSIAQLPINCTKAIKKLVIRGSKPKDSRMKDAAVQATLSVMMDVAVQVSADDLDPLPTPETPTSEDGSKPWTLPFEPTKFPEFMRPRKTSGRKSVKIISTPEDTESLDSSRLQLRAKYMEKATKVSKFRRTLAQPTPPIEKQPLEDEPVSKPKDEGSASIVSQVIAEIIRMAPKDTHTQESQVEILKPEETDLSTLSNQEPQEVQEKPIEAEIPTPSIAEEPQEEVPDDDEPSTPSIAEEPREEVLEEPIEAEIPTPIIAEVPYPIIAEEPQEKDQEMPEYTELSTPSNQESQEEFLEMPNDVELSTLTIPQEPLEEVEEVPEYTEPSTPTIQQPLESDDLEISTPTNQESEEFLGMVDDLEISFSSLSIVEDPQEKPEATELSPPVTPTPQVSFKEPVSVPTFFSPSDLVLAEESASRPISVPAEEPTKAESLPAEAPVKFSDFSEMNAALDEILAEGNVESTNVDLDVDMDREFPEQHPPSAEGPSPTYPQSSDAESHPPISPPNQVQVIDEDQVMTDDSYINQVLQEALQNMGPPTADEVALQNFIDLNILAPGALGEPQPNNEQPAQGVASAGGSSDALLEEEFFAGEYEPEDEESEMSPEIKADLERQVDQFVAEVFGPDANVQQGSTSEVQAAPEQAASPSVEQQAPAEDPNANAETGASESTAQVQQTVAESPQVSSQGNQATGFDFDPSSINFEFDFSASTSSAPEQSQTQTQQSSVPAPPSTINATFDVAVPTGIPSLNFSGGSTTQSFTAFGTTYSLNTSEPTSEDSEMQEAAAPPQSETQQQPASQETSSGVPSSSFGFTPSFGAPRFPFAPPPTQPGSSFSFGNSASSGPSIQQPASQTPPSFPFGNSASTRQSGSPFQGPSAQPPAQAPSTPSSGGSILPQPYRQGPTNFSFGNSASSRASGSSSQGPSAQPSARATSILPQPHRQGPSTISFGSPAPSRPHTQQPASQAPPFSLGTSASPRPSGSPSQQEPSTPTPTGVSSTSRSRGSILPRPYRQGPTNFSFGSSASSRPSGGPIQGPSTQPPAQAPSPFSFGNSAGSTQGPGAQPSARAPSFSSSSGTSVLPRPYRQGATNFSFGPSEHNFQRPSSQRPSSQQPSTQAPSPFTLGSTIFSGPSGNPFQRPSNQQSSYGLLPVSTTSPFTPHASAPGQPSQQQGPGHGVPPSAPFGFALSTSAPAFPPQSQGQSSPATTLFSSQFGAPATTTTTSQGPSGTQGPAAAETSDPMVLDDPVPTTKKVWRDMDPEELKRRQNASKDDRQISFDSLPSGFVVSGKKEEPKQAKLWAEEAKAKLAAKKEAAASASPSPSPSPAPKPQTPIPAANNPPTRGTPLRTAPDPTQPKPTPSPASSSAAPAPGSQGPEPTKPKKMLMRKPKPPASCLVPMRKPAKKPAGPK
ncbi:hypothetical protein M426DRAFT_23391 [Hypoxylon sp. CI-4A]|nr:hypothetical protein M426DRAFT_23391 [Hypoxylon sp. CI-4A]